MMMKFYESSFRITVPLYTQSTRRPSHWRYFNPIRNSMKFGNALLHNISANHNDILHTPPQLHCRDVCKISLWPIQFILNQSTPNFDQISNLIEYH